MTTLRKFIFVLQVDSEDVFLVTASMNNETVFRAEINLNGENDFYVLPIFKFWHKFKLIFFWY